MIVSLRKAFRRTIFLTLFAGFTVIAYGFCQLAAAYLAPDDPYRIPQGAATKVFQEQSGEAGLPADSPIERLRIFTVTANRGNRRADVEWYPYQEERENTPSRAEKRAMAVPRGFGRRKEPG